METKISVLFRFRPGTLNRVTVSTVEGENGARFGPIRARFNSYCTFVQFGAQFALSAFHST